MSIPHSKNLRIRGKYNYNTNVEEDIKDLEMQFRIDFKSLSRWKEVIDGMYAVQTECKKKLLNANNRKFQIIEKLYIQKYRVSPFELTNNFARTANLWKRNKYNNLKVHKISFTTDRSSTSLHNVSIDNVIASEESNIKSSGHPNSEIIQSKDQILKPEIEILSKLNSSHYLPAVICTNQHKTLSSIGSDYIVLSFNEPKNIEQDFSSETTKKVVPNQTILVKCYPERLMITNNSIKEQSLKFSLLNRSTEYVHIRFNNLSDASYFKTFRIFPIIPLKLNPGLSKNYELNFTLHENIDVNDISTTLYFKIGSKTAEEILYVPIKGNFEKYSSIIVTEIVNIPQVYPWQANAICGYPKGIAQIQICGNIAYDLHIRKKDFDCFKISDDIYSTESLKAITPKTESLVLKLHDDEMETRIETLLSPGSTNGFDCINIEPSEPFRTVSLVLNDILNIVHGPFIFKNVFLHLSPKCKRIVLVYFTKAHHVGYHQSCYDFMFFDSNDTVITKTVKVFAEILPHPIILYPNILDITKSPAVFGHCEDNFEIINTHKVYPVTIVIKTTNKMDKIFKITPKFVSIPAKSKVNFNIKLCKKQKLASENFDIMSYFTIKIIINGHKSVYQNIPPFYYEIIAPCDNGTIESFHKEHLEIETESDPIKNGLND